MKINGTNIYMTRGDTECLKVSCPERPFGEGDLVELTVRRFAGFGPVLIYKRADTFSDGKAYLTIAPEDTAGLPFYRDASYDVQLTFADGTVKTIIPPSRFEIGKEDTYAETAPGRH